MRTVTLRDGVLYPVAHLLGIDPAQDLNQDHAAAWASFINSRLREAWEFWDWTELDITEERAYRTIWNATRQVNLGDELLYLPTFSYYRAILQPPLGTLPTDANFYEAIYLDDFYIEPDQVGRRPIGQVIGVWSSNPRLAGAHRVSLGFRTSNRGTDINPSGSSGLSAWLTYKLKPSEVSVTEYDPTAVYKAGDLIYWLTDGNAYQAIQAGTGNDPGVPGYWRVVKIPWIFADFLKYAVAADAADDLNAAQAWRADAEETLIRQINLLLGQGQSYFYKNPRYCGYWSYAPLGMVFNGATDTSLSDQDDDFIPDAIPRFPTLETGSTPIPSFQALVDVSFVVPKSDVNYHFAELLVEWTGAGDPPYIIRAELVDNRATTGFRAVLNGGPPIDGYVLKWRVTS